MSVDGQPHDMIASFFPLILVAWWRCRTDPIATEEMCQASTCRVLASPVNGARI